MESAVRPLLDAYFSPLSGVQVLAQPDTFYVASAFSLAVSVIGKELVNRGWDGLTPGEQHRPPLCFSDGRQSTEITTGGGASDSVE